MPRRRRFPVQLDHLTFRLPPELKRQTQQLAKQRGESVTDLLLRALDRELRLLDNEARSRS